MTVAKIVELIKDFPEYVIQSDSGWECGETEMDGLWINHKEKRIVVTQKLSEYEDYFKASNWQPLGGRYYVSNLLQGGSESFEYNGGDLKELIEVKQEELRAAGR